MTWSFVAALGAVIAVIGALYAHIGHTDRLEEQQQREEEFHRKRRAWEDRERRAGRLWTPTVSRGWVADHTYDHEGDVP